MRRNLVSVAITAFLIPIIVRGLWFYRGVYRPTPPLAAPEYQELSIPVPPEGSEPQVTEPTDATGKVVLLDWAHSNLFNPTEIEDFLEDLTARNAAVEIVEDTFDRSGPPLWERLQYASAYMIFSAQDSFSNSEVAAIVNFVERGGRVLVICDPTRSFASFDDFFGHELVDVTVANTLLAPFDITFSDDYLYNLIENEGNFRNVLFHSFADDPLTAGLSSLAFYGTRSINTNSGTPLVIGDENTLSSRTDSAGDLAAAMRSVDGGVIAIGDMTFLTSPYNRVADNPRLIANLLEFLLSGQRRFDLMDFPYIFTDEVVLWITESFSISADTIPTIMGIRDSLLERGITLRVEEQLPEDSDIIVLSPFDAEDPVLDMLESVEGLVLPADEDDGFLIAPNFGRVHPAGIGLILLQEVDGHFTLFLLADTPDDLLSLAEIVMEDTLQGCLVFENTALCKVGSGEGFDFGDSADFEEFDFEFDESTLEEFPPLDEPLSPTPTPGNSP